MNAKNPWGSRKKFYITYTGLFFLLSLFVFSFILFSGKSFVGKTDGFDQHLKALIYYGQWLRQLVRNVLFEHRLMLPEFNFSIGLGSDVITTLHYYVIGDPLNLVAVIVPSRYTIYLYGALIIVRLYLAGLCFSLFCFNRGLNNPYGILAGAFVYTFCGFSLIAIRHPYFINPMIYLPLLLMGVDRVIANKRPYLLIIAVGIATISNFYFLYILGILTVVYVLGRLIFLYHRSFKQFWKPFFQLIGCAVLGIALGAVLLVPVLQVFLSDNRAGVETANMILYPRSYYSAFPSVFLAAFEMKYWTCGGFSVTAVLAVFFLFMKKKQWPLAKIFFAMATVGLLIPVVGKVFNGFSYATNRWCFAVAFIVAFILAAVWPQLIALTKKDAAILCSCFALYATITFFAEKSRKIAFFAPLAIGFASIVMLMFFAEDTSARAKKMCQKALLLATMVGIFTNAFWQYSVYGNNYASDFMDYETVMNKYEYTPDKLVKSVRKDNNDEAFFRYSGRSLLKNSSILHKTNSTQYYWSLSNANVASFQREFRFRDPMSQYWNSFDDRSAMLSLTSVRYYTVPNSSTASLPYGLEKITSKDMNKPIVDAALEAQKAELGRELSESEKDVLVKQLQSNYTIYENPYVLPLGYTYSNYVTREAFDKLTPLEKQEALLQTAVLEQAPDASLPQNEQLSLTGTQIPYTVDIPENQVTMQGNSFVVTQANATVSLLLENAVAGETYVSINGIRYAGTSAYQLYNDDTSIDPHNLYTKTIWETLTSTEQQSLLQADRFYTEPDNLPLKFRATYTDSKKSITKTLSYHTPYYSWYNARHDFEVNLGYCQNAVKSITITFPYIGTYSFDSLEVVCQPMTNYAEQIAALKTDVLENVSIQDDTVTGTISLATEKLLCLSIPYSNGWTAYVNDEPAQLLQTNTMYMGLSLPAGDHSIRLVYETPGLRSGFSLSIAAIVLLLGLILIQEIHACIKQRKKAKEV